MDSLNQLCRVRYNSDDQENDVEFSGEVEIIIHHARNIHNICIYENQDVYTKFSLTYNPDEMVSTKIAVGGGKNQEFNEKLELKVKQIDAVIKCEIWMLSRARNLMEDKLLGFALVPLSTIVSQGGKISCQNFSLSSTDLLHCPAGIVQLSLSLSTDFANNSSLNSSVNNSFMNFSGNSSISSEVVLFDRNDYLRVEFPDINAASEDQVMISKYLNLDSSSSCLGSFLHLGSRSTSKAKYDYRMTGISSEKNESNQIQNSGFLSSPTSPTADRNTADSSSAGHQKALPSQPPPPPPPSPPKLSEVGEKQKKVDVGNAVGDQRVGVNEGEDSIGTNLGHPFSGKVRNTSLEVEQTAMQKQVMDMYMKSMQQFTESLANMKLPMDLNSSMNNPNSEDVIRIVESSNDLDVENKKDGPRVFYGSRTFF